jgi:hypothetical protein
VPSGRLGENFTAWISKSISVAPLGDLATLTPEFTSAVMNEDRNACANADGSAGGLT